MTGAELSVIVDGATSGGAYVVLEVRAPAGTTVPPHSHERHAATVVVLDGELDVACAAERRALRVGDSMTLSRGAPCRLTARTTVRLLVLAAPAGLEALAPLAAEHVGMDPDDLAALLAGAGVGVVPAAWGAAA